MTNLTPVPKGKLLDKNLKQFKVISFDLDDALYDNRPVLVNAENMSSVYLKRQFELQNKFFDLDNFLSIRQKLKSSNDPRYENLSFFRQQALKEFCLQLDNSETIIEKAFELFIQARSQVSIPVAITQMLKQLSQEFVLVSVSNGNCDINVSSVGSLFNKNYSTTNGYRAKPNPQMLIQVLEEFSLKPTQLLHVGDSLKKDAGAAANAGVEFFHFAPFLDPDNVEQSCLLLHQFLKYGFSD